MRLRTIATTLLTIGIAACCALPATAGAWTQVSERSGSNTDQTSAVRGADGRLHIVYKDKVSVSEEGIRYRTMSSSGMLGAPASVVAGWAGVTSPDIELIGGLPNVFFSGLFNTDTANPMSSGQAWTANLGPGAWTVSPTPGSTNTTAYASFVSSGLDATDRPWTTWHNTYGVFTHAGFETAGPEQNLGPAAGCCGYGSNLQRDAVTGDLYLGYFSNADNETGYYVRKVAPTLDAAPTRLPRIGSDSASRDGRFPLAARTTGGVYTVYCDVYPTCTSLRVAAPGRPSLRLPLTAAQVPTLSGGSWVAAAPNGRLWVAWANRSGTFAVRSNKAVTKWGPIMRVAPVSGADTTWQVSGEGSLGFLDLFANVTAGDKTLIWTQRFKPALTLTPVTSRVVNNVTRTVTLRLTDAGDVVPGAKVKLRGVVRTVNSLGYATFTIPMGARVGANLATGAANGYVPAKATVTVVAPRR